MTAKIGIQIHPVFSDAKGNTRAYSAQEKTDLDSFLLQLQPSSIIVLNDFSWALRFANMLPNTKIVFRKEHPRDGDFWNLTTENGKPYTPQMHFEGTREHHNPRIMLNLSNEGMGKTVNTPDGKPDLSAIAKMVTWLVGCMDIFGAAGIPLVTPNFGVGLPDIKWFKSDAPEWMLIRPLFQAFKRWPIHELGMHIYWAKDGFTTTDFVNRPRDVATALEKLGYPIRSIQVTEYGSDAIDGKPGPWMDAYGDTDTGQKEYARLLVKGQRENLNLPYVHGIHVFVWGSYTRWQRYDISKAKHIQAEMIASNLNMPNTSPPYVPIPANLGTAETLMIQDAPRYSLQAKPDIAAAQNVGYVLNGEQVRLYRSSLYIADAVTFYWVERTSTPVGESPYGWIAYSLHPPIIDIPPITTADNDVRQIAIKRAQQDLLRAEIARLETEINAILKPYAPSAQAA